MDKRLIMIGGGLAFGVLIVYFVLGGGVKEQTPAPEVPAPAVETEEAVEELTEEESLMSDEEELAQTLNLVSGNFFFEPSSYNAASGEIVVSVEENKGFHTFVIDELGVKETLASGTTFSFTADAGEYEYYCDVPGHKEKGMTGMLTVN